MTATNLCDSCIGAAHNDAGFDLDPDSAAIILTELGADISDHFCDGADSGETCLCACNRPNEHLRDAPRASQAAHRPPSHPGGQASGQSAPRRSQKTQAGAAAAPQPAGATAPHNRRQDPAAQPTRRAATPQPDEPREDQQPPPPGTLQPLHPEHHHLAVGKPNGGRPRKMPQGPVYNFRHSQHTLDLYLDTPTQDEVSAFRDNPIHLGFWLDCPVLWIIFHIQGMEWADAPYTPHLVEPQARTFPDTSHPDTRATLVMTLNDARDSTVSAIRLITMSPGLTRALHAAVSELSQAPHNPAEYQAHIQRTYSEYPDTAGMTRNAAMTEQLGA